MPRFLGYEVSQTTTITLRDLSKYESLMIKLLEAGTNRVDGINFGVSETRELRDQARSRAIRDAKEKAIAMAADSVKQSANHGTFPGKTDGIPTV